MTSILTDNVYRRMMMTANTASRYAICFARRLGSRRSLRSRRSLGRNEAGLLMAYQLTTDRHQGKGSIGASFGVHTRTDYACSIGKGMLEVKYCYYGASCSVYYTPRLVTILNISFYTRALSRRNAVLYL